METLRGTDDGKRPEQWPSGRIWPCFASHSNQASQSSGMLQDSSVQLRVGRVPDKPQGLPDSSWVPHPQPRPGSSLLLDFLQLQASSTPSPRTTTFTSFGLQFPDLQWDDDDNGLCENSFPETTSWQSRLHSNNFSPHIPHNNNSFDLLLST